MKGLLHSHVPIVIIFILFTFIFGGFTPKQSDKAKIYVDEICDNGIDDNNDGLIDLNDPFCTCIVVEPISLIPNPSFEDMNCCPSGRSQLNCASVWIQASEPTTDYINTCDWLGWNNFPPPFPFPDGEGIMGFRDGRVIGNNMPERDWKEYAGACLLSPLVADSSYRFDFEVGFVSNLLSPPVNITFFGTSDCSNLPFGVGNEAFGCPTNGPGWVRLGSTLVSGGAGNRWVNASIVVVPNIDIRAIAIGPDCPHVQSPVSIYYFFDNLLLADFRSFELDISEISHPCENNFMLKVPENTDFDYQWYKEGIALIGETSFQLSKIYGEGDYQVRIDDGTSCRVSVNYCYTIPVITAPLNKTICEEEIYTFGDQQLSEPGLYVDTFKSINNCDSVVFLNLKVLGTLADTVSVKIFEGESYKIGDQRFSEKGDHFVNLKSSMDCDSLVLLQLDFFKLYIPNVFSPNGDGFNDIFSILSEEELMTTPKITIFNRWGNMLFNGVEWDGRYKGEFVESGVYTFIASFVTENGNEQLYSGSITVIR